MYQRTSGDIARAHRFPVPLSDAALQKRDQSVLVRYDGKRIEDENIMFVILSVADLAKLPPEVMDLREADIDGETAFFRETPAGVSLYLEADTHAERLMALRNFALSGPLGLLDCLGDLRIMGAPDALRAPARPAYEENDFGVVDAKSALRLLEDLSCGIELARKDHEDSALSAGL